MTNFIRKNKGFIIVTLVYLFTFLYMLPLRNQTYQDDWAYIQSVRDFLNTGILKVSEWSSASLIFPIYWGSIFSKIFGYSIQSLHLSTIAILYLGTISFYFLLKRLHLNDTKAIFFSVILFSFPWVFQFSYSFLTDIPFMSLSIITILFYTISLQENKTSFYFLGSIFATFSFLTRQLGVVFPLSIFIILVYLDISQKKFVLKRYLAALFPFLILALFYILWLKTDGNLTNGQYQASTIFFKQTMPYLTPFNIPRIGTTYGYYLSYVQRIVIYFHLCIGFLVPIFLVFKPNLNSIKKFLLKQKFALLITSSIYLILIAFEIFQHYARKTFVLEIPTLITRSNILPALDFNHLWIYLVFISVIIWLPIITKTLLAFFGSFLIPLKKRRTRLFILMLTSGLLVCLYYEFLVFQHNFKNYHPLIPYTDVFTRLSLFIYDIKTPLGEAIISNTLIILFVLSLGIFLLALLFSFFKINLHAKIKNPEQGFIFLSFVFIYSILIFYMYFYWHQYIISIIPYFIISIAVISRKWKVNGFRMFAVCILLLIFSVGLTKNRYEDQGIQWELANQLVQKKGVKPIEIGPADESWLPWWYFQDTFKLLTQTEFGGNKYNIVPARWATWRIIKPDPNQAYRYDFVKVGLNYIFPESKDKKVLIDETTNYTLFTKVRYLVVESKTK